MAQLVRAPPCHGGGRGFEPHPGRLKRMLHLIAYGILAQLGEHLPYKQRVIGSSPIGPIFMAESLSWLEHTVHTRGVEGSNPPSAIFLCLKFYIE